MKNTSLIRCAAAGMAVALAAALAGCGSSASSASTGETAESTPDAAAEDAATGETAESAYAYLADFDLSAPLDENGYFTGVKAGDYVTLPENYASMTMAAGADQITDEELDNYITNSILSTYAAAQQVTDRAAEMGDTVNIDYVGSVDGVEFDGGNTQGNGADLTLGSGSYIDDFEEQIAGHTPGETFNVTVTFPDPYTGNADLSGKEAVFVTTLNYISEQVAPELTDEWVVENLQEAHGFTTAEEFRARVRSDLIYEKESNDLYLQLVEGVTLADELPQTLTGYYTDMILNNAYSYASAYGMDLESFLPMAGYESVEAYLAQGQSSIDSAVRQALIMQAIAEEKGIVCDDAALEEELAARYGSNADSYLAQYGRNYLKMTLLQDMAMEALIAGATVAGQ